MSGGRGFTPLELVFETTTSPNDTTLLHPYRVYLWGDQVAVLDIQGMRVVAFDLTGRHRWTQGRAGEGPGEYRAPSAATLASNGNLLVLDPANARITQLTSEGEVTGQYPTQQLGILATDMTMAGDRLVLLAPRATRNMVRVNALNMNDARTGSLAWPDSAPAKAHVVFSMVTDARDGYWGSRASIWTRFLHRTIRSDVRPPLH